MHLIVLCTPLAWWLAHTTWRGKVFVEALDSAAAHALAAILVVLAFTLLFAVYAINRRFKVVGVAQ